MTTLTLNQSRPRSVAPLVILALVLLAVMYTSHAILQHGQYAENVRKCLEQQPPDLVMHNPFTGRDALCVKMPDGKFGVQIVEGEREVTSFPNKSTTLEKLAHYLMNAGYSLP